MRRYVEEWQKERQTQSSEIRTQIMNPSDNDFENEEDNEEEEMVYGHVSIVTHRSYTVTVPIGWLIVGALLVIAVIGLVAWWLGHGHR